MLLAIETSCDETAAAVVQSDLEVRSSVVATQIPVHARYGGVVPELASRSHLTALGPVVRGALEQSGCALEDIEAIGVTAGPGLAGCLLVGLQTAKALAWSLGVPLVPVDHIEAHIQAIFLKDSRGAGEVVPEYPFIALAVSGGHTSLYRVEGPRDLELLGQTLDDAAGEAFDKTAKMMGLPYPGGVHIDRLAQDGDVAAVALPRPMLHRGLDFSFSGLKTAVRYQIEGEPAEGVTGPNDADLAASLQEAIVDVLCTKAIRAARDLDIRDIVVAGGVACNSRLRAKMVSETTPHGIRAHLVPGRYCTDNAAMIGGLAVQLLAQGGGLTGEALTRADIHVTRRPARQPRARR
ncbi:MAG: tRNA (adenosine(37)-N6)-threonylcarbamoyltransferase complex transferase subunit TsaD [Myxococcota bacterium]|nr:tRNA (adenosine(37)-N6)-threonylcarbamoyltransferase complex transferase subunit TsaD [Myxococcota bacterium]